MKPLSESEPHSIEVSTSPHGAGAKGADMNAMAYVVLVLSLLALGDIVSAAIWGIGKVIVDSEYHLDI